MPSADTTVSPSKGAGSMKAKMLALNSQLEDQDASISSVRTRLESMEEIVGEGGSGLEKEIQKHTKIMQERLMETINAIQEDCDHKFSLQAAENKRMQQHLSTAKRENQTLTKRLVALEERVAVLELELGGDNEEDEEF
ncbi:hypothetical protein TrST_g13900 [Triparma strigata]|uniref:Uncharacterized protein n=1 Tax=Triparma strigata TaxID=1606541 RepID=A0A9W7BH55_9STRA|nr:hypothetical protein TrST_g13900 [Triparma strigata]